jgi:hypothetical protein
MATPLLVYHLRWPDVSLQLSIHIDPGTGKFDAFFFTPE